MNGKRLVRTFFIGLLAGLLFFLLRIRLPKILADAVSGLSTHKADYLNAVGLGESTRFWGVNYPNSYQGDTPYGCNERIGKCAMRLLTDQAVRIIRALKYDENILRWNEEDNARW